MEIDLLHKSHIAAVPYSIMDHFVAEMWFVILSAASYYMNGASPDNFWPWYWQQSTTPVNILFDILHASVLIMYLMANIVQVICNAYIDNTIIPSHYHHQADLLPCIEYIWWTILQAQTYLKDLNS